MPKMHHLRELLLLVVGLGTALGLGFVGGCSKSSAPRLSGGGATLPDPIIQKWKIEYKQSTGVEIDYQKSGSGDGIKGVTNRTLQFACSDAPMNKKEVAEATKEGGEIIHIPVTMAAVAVVYHLPGIDSLVLDIDVLAQIYLGDDSQGSKELKDRVPLKWNDPRIAKLNPTLQLPDQPIRVVCRSEGSGTTNIFTEYLGKSSKTDFASKIPTSKLPTWPKFVAGQSGSDGIAGYVQKNEYSIGYVELTYAKTNKITYAWLLNKRGKPVAPEAKAITAAANAVLAVPKSDKELVSPLHDLTFSLTDVDDDAAYPICGMSYALLYKKQKSNVGKPLVEFLKWATSKGQDYAEALDYAPMPESLTKKIHARLDEVIFE